MRASIDLSQPEIERVVIKSRSVSPSPRAPQFPPVGYTSSHPALPNLASLNSARKEAENNEMLSNMSKAERLSEPVSTLPPIMKMSIKSDNKRE